MSEYSISDIHSHILFDIDDGAADIDESLQMLKLAQEQGVKNVFCTSHHWSSDTYKYDRNFALLRERSEDEGINVNIFEGMEVICSVRRLDEIIKEIKNGSAKTMNGTDFVLLEMFTYMSAQEIFDCVNSVFERTGKRVILAHVERYDGLYRQDMIIKCLKELGCLFQINAFSLVDESDEDIKAFARKLLAEKAVDFIGSDAHRLHHRPPKLLSGVEYIYKNCDCDYADAVCFSNAGKVLCGQHI